MRHPILFYDGHCGLCNRSVQFILRHEKNSVIQFSPIQSDFSRRFFEEHKFVAPDLTTFYFYTNRKIYTRSEAVFKIIPHLKYYWQFLRLFSFLPRSFTNLLYDKIAQNRRKLNIVCGNFSPEQRLRILEY